MAKKSSLGRGLGALIPDYNMSEVETSGAVELKIIDVEPNKDQPRKQFDQQKLDSLTSSIKVHGVIQPILVVKKDDRYQIIAGERRWRAAKNAGLKVIPAIIREYDETTVMEVALIENLQREDLNPIEEAQGYHSLMEKFDMTQEKISERVGKSRSAVANALRLLHLAKDIQAMLEKGEITGGHAKAILSLSSKAQQLELAKLIVLKGMSVRDTENYVKLLGKPKTDKPKMETELKRYLSDLENDISSHVGTKVKIHHNKGKGKIEIQYYSNDDLERLIVLLKNDNIFKNM